MKNIDSITHVSGTSVYLDDVPVINGTLYGAAFGSPCAHGVISELILDDALQLPEVVRIFTAADIPGHNEIGGIIKDEPLLADTHVHFCGMPIAFVVARSREAARAAVKKIRVKITSLPVITDPREAQAKGELIVPPRTFRLGNTDSAWEQCAYVITGNADINGQEHLYIETQGAYAIPQENNSLRIYSSTQGPTAVQRAVSGIIGQPMHRFEVIVTRLGGGFGGKEDQANTWAALCALAAWRLNKPVKYALHRMEDMAMTGKRHPYAADFKIGLDKDLKILAYEASFFQNAGASADLSPAVLARTLFHCTNSYYIPHVTATGWSCRTNLPPNTAFRGFGGPQGMFVIEAAIAKAAHVLQVDAALIQRRNLIRSGQPFPYGQIAESEAPLCWEKLEERFDITEQQRKVKQFNENNSLFKKGIALMPVCFGISFTNTLMNNARSLVHVYSDGSVGISTGAVEMGQGVNTKILQVAAQVFSIPADKVRLHHTSTNTIANTSPSAASATADLNGKATLIACTAIVERLKQLAAVTFAVTPADITLVNGHVLVNGLPSAWDWYQLVTTAFAKRICLSEHGHYATPQIHYDAVNEKGHPFAYHVYGTAMLEATVDCIRGTYTIDAVKVVHDFGNSMNTDIDRGQIEGGIVQGIGWMTMEEVLYDRDGKLRSNALSTYKVPDIYAAPATIAIEALQTDRDNLAVFRSKAVGEPPLMYGIGAWFALQNAVRAFHPNADIPFVTPMTPEKVLMALYSTTNPETNHPHAETVSHLGIDQ
ncbi:molybdopterin cofactor-binding domain-containing protein [Chitinophaga rhizophila]|uniref:Molybdopterin-dependent oxidoreductase n=1 Tax=Chitinophaga rhizophila TaxID=2866212 RepID=A0ABS7GCY1_9BACT|nr:molybdopterin cofactor-binding domain-containing protein [Chitinophaga rhizophila]MBW8685281.1 molybdopterin-dependent oxidoreductase [Chitinophaga rhizophila]